MLKKISVPKSIIFLAVFSFILIVLRVRLFDRYSLVYLLWNILLAFIPYLISYILHYLNEEKILNKTIFILGSILWLLFLPNAPYIVTDLIHIGVVRGVPVLYDSILLFTSAWLGLLLGLHSIFHMEEIIKTRYSKVVTNRIILVVLLLVSFGMHLGREFRFNSWDVFISPVNFSSKMISIFSLSVYHLEAIGYTVLFFAFLYVSYQSFKFSQIK